MTDLHLTPIGTSPAWYNPGEPNSGFLLEVDGFRLLIDCGSGVIARYLEMFGADYPIDAVIISHMHADHCFDLVPMKFGMDYGPLREWNTRLWLPPNGRDRLNRLVSMWDEGPDFFAETFEIHEYGASTSFGLGPITASALEVPHYIESMALRFDFQDVSFGYSGDLGPTKKIAPFMSGVDLLLAEAGFAEHGDLDLSGRGHITATEAGTIARAAGAHSLLLTHVPVENGIGVAEQSAADVFAGPVEVAQSGMSYSVARRLAAAG